MMFMQLFCLFLSGLLRTIDLELGSIMIYVSYIIYNNTNEWVKNYYTDYKPPTIFYSFRNLSCSTDQKT